MHLSWCCLQWMSQREWLEQGVVQTCTHRWKHSCLCHCGCSLPLSAKEVDGLPLSCIPAARHTLGVLVRSLRSAVRGESRQARVPPQVPELRNFGQLQRLELSYNELRSLAPLSALASPALEELFAASNKLPCIEARLRMERRSVCCASCTHSSHHQKCINNQHSPTAMRVHGYGACIVHFLVYNTQQTRLPSCCLPLLLLWGW